jgi:hypothetical protein
VVAVKFRFWERSPNVGDIYGGTVAYVDGAHYPVYDEAAGPDLRHRLRWVDLPEPGHFEFAAVDDPTHEHVYHRQHVEVVPEP